MRPDKDKPFAEYPGDERLTPDWKSEEEKAAKKRKGGAEKRRQQSTDEKVAPVRGSKEKKGQHKEKKRTKEKKQTKAKEGNKYTIDPVSYTMAPPIPIGGPGQEMGTTRTDSESFVM